MKAVVLHSGGLDSTVCLLTALERGREVLSLGINYGQRHSVEMTYAAQQAKKFGVERHEITVHWHKPHRTLPLDRDLATIRAESSPAFLPGRNLLFLSIASCEAAGIGAEEVWIGVNEIDFSGYADCRGTFIDAFCRTLLEAIPTGPELVAPLLRLTKPEIAIEARRLGLQENDTWSCYRPQVTETGIAPCHRCDACILHSHAWAAAAQGASK